MSITIDALTKSTVATFQHTCAGDNRLLIVTVAWDPSNDQELSGISCDGVALPSPYCVQIESSLALGFAALVAPGLGAHDIQIAMSGPNEILCEACSLNGVDQSNAVWRVRDGVGKMVTEIPVHTWAKIGAMTLGLGAVNNLNAGVDRMYGNQVLQWDGSGANLRMNGISAIGLVNIDDILLPNKLTQPSDWALIIVGINAA